MITVNSRSYDGSIRRTWTCDLISRDNSLLTLVGTFDTDVEHPDLGHLRKGTVSHEYYWLDRWYNIFLFREPSGEFRNYYCNVNMPPTLTDGVLDYVDLDIDIVVWPDGSYVVLDREDYESNSIRFGYPPEVQAKVEASVEELLDLVSTGNLPDAANAFGTAAAPRREMS